MVVRVKLKDVVKWLKPGVSAVHMEEGRDAKFLGATSPLSPKVCAQLMAVGRRVKWMDVRNGGSRLVS